ncbi:hypothetical protein JO972_06135 [Verrucomicrobiaceae bacterium 5K15]|uniref:DoxX family protein n=1 Tax=Oceaniferula flava TaxID=2800421 RepID=A0AAE2SAZ2_9BACT|nr:hypothetical protein [Oceaniferula flavus]MBK1854528.1 hypothetical protein [Oceaniferula flavus]MBM1135834.1 hypothetical protein [Oceaniferula flavus]
MKQLPNIAGALLGLAFLLFGLNHFFHFLKMPSGGESGPHTVAFFTAISQSGYLDFLKVMEILGAILVVIPKSRNWGLLILGPVVINIIAINLFIKGHGAVFAPPVIIIAALSAYLLWAGRQSFLALLNSTSKQP